VNIGVYPEYGRPLDFKGIAGFIKKGKADGTLKYREVCGGYHDAADYDRRAIHIPIARELCRVYEMNPAAFIDRQFVIPESGNGLPDILDEASYLLSYYLETQWADGGISGGSEGTGHPFSDAYPGNAWRSNTDNESVEYIMRPVSGYSCFAFAASAAQLGRILGKFPEGKEQGSRLVDAARRAFSCGIKKFPPEKLSDEISVAEAAAELLHATGESRYATAIDRLPTIKGAKVDYLNNISLAYTFNSLPSNLPGLDDAFRGKLKKGCSDAVGWAVNAFTLKKGYIHFKHPWAPLGNGTASTAQAWWMALMWKMTGERKYYDLLCASADVVLGANPMGQVQCSGLGQRHLLHPEYLESMNDDLEEYLPGIWVYGPSSGKSWITGIYPPTPAVEVIPPLYSFYDVDQWPGQTEFTVSETITPAVVMFGALAPENPRPYTGPLPSPR
jgi:endoglucanase